jgi:S-sulfosulfanyl-L-cysteine sulfohydrolase
MVRVGGLSYSCSPNERMGRRIGDLRLKGRPIEAGKSYKVASWAPVAEPEPGVAQTMVWDLVEGWLKSQGGHVKARRINTPRLIGVDGNPGLS